MKPVEWKTEIRARKDDMITTLQELIRIPSVKGEAEDGAPFGKPVREALQFMLDLGKKDGFQTKQVGDVAGHIEMGAGEELIGILCHVDVVPEGEDWTYPPFAGEVADGKLYGRGAIDDKGPTIAAYMAMKAVKEQGIPLEKRVRMIIGTDEESGWECVEHYFAHEDMPSAGFAPDADFPIIFAEKGIADVRLTLPIGKKPDSGSAVELHSFKSGRRFNMVPDEAKATLTLHSLNTLFLQNYTEFLKDNGYEGTYYMEKGVVHLVVKGVSAHAMEPDQGQNAALRLAAFLNSEPLDGAGKQFVQAVTAFFLSDSRGEKLGIAAVHPEMGDLTVNAALFSYRQHEEAAIGLNIRYPKEVEMTEVLEQISTTVAADVTLEDNSLPHYVSPDDPFIQTLKHVYEAETGEPAELLTIGGGTYARALQTGVAFGALFPGREDVAHQRDEHVYIEDLERAAAIYARAIVALAGKQG